MSIETCDGRVTHEAVVVALRVKLPLAMSPWITGALDCMSTSGRKPSMLITTARVARTVGAPAHATSRTARALRAR